MPLARVNRTTDPESVRLRLTRLFAASRATPPDAAPTDPTPPDAAPTDSTPPDAALSARPPVDPPSPAELTGDAASPGTNRLPERLAAAFGLDKARVDLGGPGIRSLAVVALLVVLVAAGLAWWTAPRPEQVAAPAPAPPSARPSPSATGVVVAVAGKVRRPGLVTLPPGARVADAIKAAGGVLPGTDVGYLNLARKLTDGELIVVGETPPPGAPGDRVRPGAPGTKINLNTASLQQLDELPGVGPVLAQRILDYRDQHGGFRSVDDLRKVDGIGPARYDELKGLVTV